MKQQIYMSLVNRFFAHYSHTGDADTIEVAGWSIVHLDRPRTFDIIAGDRAFRIEKTSSWDLSTMVPSFIWSTEEGYTIPTEDEEVEIFLKLSCPIG